MNIFHTVINFAFAANAFSWRYIPDGHVIAIYIRKVVRFKKYNTKFDMNNYMFRGAITFI